MNPFVYGNLARERDRDTTRRIEKVSRAHRARFAHIVRRGRPSRTAAAITDTTL